MLGEDPDYVEISLERYFDSLLKPEPTEVTLT
jgi:hypothetical protein